MTLLMWRPRYYQTGLMGIILGTTLVVSCSAVPMGQNRNTSSADHSELAVQTAESMGDRDRSAPADPFRGASLSLAAAESSLPPVESNPQLVKQANLVVILTDLDTAVKTIQKTTNQVQGDLLGLEDRRSPEGLAHQITLTLRVPQDRLEVVLADISALGTVQQQSISAEDVADQLVDLDARLKNLRKSEAALLEIMDRSGDIADVLEVSHELSTVRESIERMTAQQQSLKRQVAYSHIYLTLKSPTSAVAPLRPAGETLGNTWQAASRSVKVFTLNGLRLSLWLLAYSPYIAVLAVLVFGGYRRWHPGQVTSVEADREHG